MNARTMVVIIVGGGALGACGGNKQGGQDASADTGVTGDVAAETDDDSAGDGAGDAAGDGAGGAAGDGAGDAAGDGAPGDVPGPGPDVAGNTWDDVIGDLDWSGVEVRLVSLDAVEVGSCVAPARDLMLIRDFAVVDCGVPHPMEVGGRHTLAGSDYPGGTDIIKAAYDGCMPIVEAHLGEPFWDSPYDIHTVSPSPATWSKGDRSVLCLVKRVDGAPLTGALGD